MREYVVLVGYLPSHCLESTDRTRTIPFHTAAAAAVAAVAVVVDIDVVEDC